MRPILRLPALLLIGTIAAPLLSGCQPAVDPCDQFAPPVGKAPNKCPAKPVTDKDYKPAKYCYSSLGQAECYAEPQPGRSGYIGPAN